MKVILALTSAIFFCPSAMADSHCPGERAGVGVTVSFVDGYPTVSEIFPDSPAAIDGRIKVGDRIEAVANESEPLKNTKGLIPQDFACIATGKPASKVTFMISHKGNLESSKVELVRKLNP